MPSPALPGSASHTPPSNTFTFPDNQNDLEQTEPRNVSHSSLHTIPGEHITVRPQPPPTRPQQLSTQGSHPSHILSPIRQRSDSPAISSGSRPKKKRMRMSARGADAGSADERTYERDSPSPSPSFTSSQDDRDREDEDDELHEDMPRSSAEQPQSARIPTTTATGGASAGAPPKKKRTRTLTTPYQAQKLFELLEQSRFPTTAQREQVGREIGLTPRKVQVWFQNQRQKAKKPKAETKQTAQPSVGPQSLGSYQSVLPGPGPALHAPMPTVIPVHTPPFMEGSSGAPMRDIAPAPPQARRAPQDAYPPPPSTYTRSSRPARLTGPGVPGDDFVPPPRGSMSPPAGVRSGSGRSNLPGLGGYTPYSSEAGLHSDTRAEEVAYSHERRPNSRTELIQLPPLHRAPERHSSIQSSRMIPHSPPRPPSASEHASPYSRHGTVLPPPHHRSPISPQSLPPPFALEPDPHRTSRSSITSSERGTHSSAVSSSQRLGIQHDYASSHRSPVHTRFDPVRSSTSEEGVSGARSPSSHSSDTSRERRSPRQSR